MGSSTSKPTSPSFSLQLPQPAAKPTFSVTGIIFALAMIAVVFAIVIYFSKSADSTTGSVLATDLSPTETDGKSGTTVDSGVSGSNTGLQFWMYIKDWDYKFGKKKMVIAQTDSVNPAIVSPGISLHPTDNSLEIEVSVYSGGSNLATSNTGTGESQIITIENVPLQSWFAVSVTIFQRNLDVYINGRLVRSVVLAGIPKPVSGKLVIGGKGGFSGSVCTVHASSNQLTPSEATAFYAAGTPCFATGSGSTGEPKMNNLSLFGYTFVFGVKDSAGKDVTGLSSSDVSDFFGSSKK
jgi:hypothetical protein